MDSMKSFTTAAERAGVEGTEEDSWTFDVDGFEMTAYRPGEGQLAILMVDTGRHTSTSQRVAGAINFFTSVLDDRAAAHITERLLDRKDPFGLAEVQEIMEWLITEMTGQDFASPSGSTSSPRAGGRKSRQPTPAST